MAVDAYTSLAVQIAIVAIMLLAVYVLSRVTASVLRRALQRTGVYETDAIVISTASKYLVWLLGVFMVLSYLSIQVTPYLVALLAVSLIVTGLAAKTPLENVASWYLLRNWGPFEVGDFVKIGDVEGVVRSLDLFQMTVETPNSRCYPIPNAKIVSLGGYKLARQDDGYPVTIRVRLGCDIDIEPTKLRLVKIVQAFPHFSFDRSIKVVVRKINDKNIVLKVLFWVPKLGDIFTAKDYVSTRILTDLVQTRPNHARGTVLHGTRRGNEMIRKTIQTPKCSTCGSTTWKGFLRCTDCGGYYVFGQCIECDQPRLGRCPVEGEKLEFVPDEDGEV